MPTTSQARSTAYAVGFFAGFAAPKGIDQGPRAEVIPPGDPGYDQAPRSVSRRC